jgi:hypothetical protein
MDYARGRTGRSEHIDAGHAQSTVIAISPSHSVLAGPARNGRTWASCRTCYLAWSRRCTAFSPRILRKDLCVELLPLPLIVHTAPTASRAATPSLRDASCIFDPSRHDEESGIYEGAGGE